MSTPTNGPTFELPCSTSEAIRFITLAHQTFERDAPNWPEKYKEFIALLLEYRDGNLSLRRFLPQVQNYLTAHPQLLEDFNQFVPPGFGVISSIASAEEFSTIAKRRRNSRSLLTEQQLVEQKPMVFLEKVKAAYRKEDGSDGFVTRMFLDLLERRKDQVQNSTTFRSDIHALFVLDPSLANEFDQFLHREYFEEREEMTSTPSDSTQSEGSDHSENQALSDEDKTPTQKLTELPDSPDMDVDKAEFHSSQARTPSPIPYLFYPSRTVSVDSSPSNRSVTLSNNALSSPYMEDVKQLDVAGDQGSPNLTPLPFYPVFDTTSAEQDDDGWQTSTGSKRLRSTKGLMDSHLDRRRRSAAPAPCSRPIARKKADYPLTCNPRDTTFANGVVSMPPDIEANEDGWIHHGPPASRSVLYPFAAAAGRDVRLETAPTQVGSVEASSITIPLTFPPPRTPPASLPPRPTATSNSSPLRRSYAKVVQSGSPRAPPSPPTATRMFPVSPSTPRLIASASDSNLDNLHLSTLPSTWVSSGVAGPSRVAATSAPASRSVKKIQKKAKSNRGVGSDPDPAIPSDSVRKTYGYGAVGDGRPRKDVKWIDESRRSDNVNA